MAETTLDSIYEAPMGPRFSQLYLERGAARDDSSRLRHRIGAFFARELHNYTSEATAAIETRIGTDHRFNGYAVSVAEYLRTCTATDFRDAITVIHWGIMRQFAKDRYTSTERAARTWRDFCRDAFVEENVAYRVDQTCVVRPFVDEEFARTATAALRGLQDSRLRAVRAEVERALDDLGGKQPDYKGAVRATFEALEIYAKLAVTTCKVPRLNRNIVMEHIVRVVQSELQSDEPAQKAAFHVGEAIVDWLNACHLYRHGQDVNEPAPPPPELAVALVSAGLSHLRWLLDALPLHPQ